MELRHLRYFIAVGEELSFTRAAERLATAQPSLSQQIRVLEIEIGTDLIDRVHRPRIALTPAGVEFLERARALVAGVDVAVASAREVARGMRGELRIAYTPSAMMSTLPAAIRAFRAQRPDVRITLRATSLADVLVALRARDADIGVMLTQRDLRDVPEIFVREIDTLGIKLVVAEDHRLAKRRSASIEEIGREPLILYARHLADLYDVTMRLCLERNFVPARIDEADRVESILGLVAAGEGVSIVPGVYDTFGFRGVSYVKLRPAPVPFSIVVARNAGASSELARAFADVYAGLEHYTV